MCKFGRHSPVGRAERASTNNRRKLQFKAFKFRTMHVNGDDFLASFPDIHKEPALNHKLKNDPRITRLGIFLRKTSLDNLSQLIEVLHGNMSLIGPRTITAEEMGNIFVIGASGWIFRFCSKPFRR